jgi:nucleotide-binding universal stress UspA family protein
MTKQQPAEGGRAMTDNLFYRIVVPTDFSECAEHAWALAQRVSAASGGELVLVHVLVEAPPFGETAFTMDRTQGVYEAARAWGQKSLEAWMEQAQRKGLKARVVLRAGAPYREILDLATDERADLIVIGTHGRGGIDRALLGSVADRVVRLAPCPVLTVRASD